ncbi:MAG: PorT family protein [Dysgonamonadaceae bacterium]|jgi:opacity protein-like surface antigen|nr:PorT family protein [Dysgonamonadaceae bacterium]
MKTFRKIFLAVTFVLIAVSANAQFSYGVKAGLNLSTLNGLKDALAEGENSNYKPGFHIGVAAQYMFTPQAGIETGLYYTTLGVKTSLDYSEEAGGIKVSMKEETTLSPAYLQLPVSFLYKFQIGEGLSLYPQVGIYLGYGIGGKIKAKVTGDFAGISANRTMERNFFGEDAMKITEGEGKGETETVKTEFTNRFDLGGTVGLNLQYTNFVFGVGYDLGLLKVNKEEIEGEAGKKLSDWKNGNIRVSVGYFF